MFDEQKFQVANLDADAPNICKVYAYNLQSSRMVFW